MSKPRIQYQRGNWYCSVRSMNMTVSGVGNSPENAYVDWRRRCEPDKYRYLSAWDILSRFRKPV